MDGPEVAIRCGPPSGTRWRVHLHGEAWVADGDVGPDFFMVLRQDLQKMEVEPPDTTDHDAGSTCAGMRGTKVDGSWVGFVDDLIIKDVLPDHTADSTKDVILNDAESPDNELAEDRYM